MPASSPFPDQPRWFLPRIEPFQERLGGRISLVAEINVAGSEVMTYNLHLESRGDDELRLSQMEEVLSDAASCAPKFPQIIAGDLNLDASNPRLAEALSAAGFRDAVQAARTPTTPPRRLLEAGRQIDWAFVRGPIQANRGQVHQSVRASDHPISFDLHPPK